MLEPRKGRRVSFVPPPAQYSKSDKCRPKPYQLAKQQLHILSLGHLVYKKREIGERGEIREREKRREFFWNLECVITTRINRSKNVLKKTQSCDFFFNYTLFFPSREEKYERGEIGEIEREREKEKERERERRNRRNERESSFGIPTMRSDNNN